MKLTSAQLDQLRSLDAGRGAVNLQLVKALIRRGLARERYAGELASHCRMPGAYPLTKAGKQVLRENEAST